MSLINRIGLVSIGFALILCTGQAVAEVVAVVSAQSPVTTLSKNQVVDIFLGRMSRFPGGEQAVPIDQEEGSAARDEFYARFAELSPAQVKAHWSKIIFTGRGLPPNTVSNSIEVKKAVVKNPNAIGYIERSLVDHSVKLLLTP
jgi:ABC-type phosphate transport system substrate-binding protein